MTEKRTIQIHNKNYEYVASRVERFREEHPNHGLRTELLHTDDKEVIMKAWITEGDFVLAVGHAHEKWGVTAINTTSALENCETSAIGRALAAYGYLGGEYASADEVANAIKQQSDPDFHQGYIDDAHENIAQTLPPAVKKQGIHAPMRQTETVPASILNGAGGQLSEIQLTQLDMAPKQHGLTDNQKKEIWSRAYEQGWKRGKWNPAKRQWDRTTMNMPIDSFDTIMGWIENAVQNNEPF